MARCTTATYIHTYISRWRGSVRLNDDWGEPERAPQLREVQRPCLYVDIYTVIREIFVCESSREKNFMLKYFCGLGLPRKYITTNIYTCMKYYIRKMEDYTRNLGVHGFHVYHDIWKTAEGEVLQCERGTGNAKDRYAVAVKKDRTVIGHLPKKVSRACSLFLRRVGNIQCSVTGRRQYFYDLPQGDLEIPCSVKFTAKSSEVKKLKQLLK